MRNEEADGGRVPARVLLRGEPDGWHCVVVTGSGAERRWNLAGAGTRWQTHEGGHEGGRGGAREGYGPEPPWWRRRLCETADALREAVAERLTDATFRELGAEAAITWFALEEPVEWEGLVTLQEPDPARFPGRVPPFVITLDPGRGALLPDADLLFSTHAPDAWATLTALAERCGAPPPKSSFLCGWAGHRSVRVGRGRLALSSERGEDGAERLAEIFGTRRPGWSGNPELRLRLDGIDLLDEPANDVVTLLGGLGHEIVRRGRTVRLPAIGLTLYEPERDPVPGSPDAFQAEDGTERFAGVALRLPSALAAVRTLA
ncbi:hypothetical protein [Actinomadura litoris]|uniref:Uncharacterized protein n=1 Tax=Actinomadura litoris TaxID=2678616 RepID=A0A7K1L6V6_9ACTN|nr:hypothetical protein [Actinomadura litoris]MUN40140.1 hypothetical protein [Actinomadura litoris]